MWHLTLVFSEPADAYVAVTIGEHLLWDKTIPIPQPGSGLLQRVGSSGGYRVGRAHSGSCAQSR